MTKKNEVALKEKNEAAVKFASMFDVALESSGDTLDAVDLRIPKLTLIQDMTKGSYNTDNAPVGNYIDSIDKNDLGSSVDMFVMSDTKLWEIKYDVKEGKKVITKYLGTIDYTTLNSDLKTNPRIPVELAKRANDLGITADAISQLNMINRFYVLKVSEVLEGVAFPYIVDFKRSSYQAGVQLKNSFFKMKKVQKLPSYARVFSLSSDTIEDEFKYSIKTVSAGRMITPEEIQAVESWVREMSTNKEAYEDDNSEDENENVIEVQTIDMNTPRF